MRMDKVYIFYNFQSFILVLLHMQIFLLPQADPTA
jgi:hypothetical protein